MGKCKTKAIQTDLGIFTYIPAYLVIFRHNQKYSGTFQTFRTLGNPSIFRTLVYSEALNTKK